jgi:hypothetical protein
VLNGVEETVGVAVCVGDELAVGVGVWAEAVGVGDCVSAVAVAVAVAEASGVCALSAEDVAVGLGSCASAMPPSTAAYRPAQQRARARIFLKVTRLLTRAWSAAGTAATPLNFGIARPALEQSGPSCADSEIL